MNLLTENPFDSLHATITGQVRDMSADRRDAWMYGIIVGWEDSIDDICQTYGWNTEAKERLQRLHATFNEHKVLFKD